MCPRMRSSSSRSPLRSRWIPRTATLALALGAMTGCLDRPVTPQRPTTSNVVVRTVRHVELDKLDLLFMIDNSLSMADKQEILSQAVPVLIRRLVTPNCVDAEGRPNGTVTNDTGSCAEGRPEMRSVKDIHIGVVTSSMGSHGGTDCLPQPDDATTLRTPDDRGELLPTANPAVRGTLGSWNGSGFLAWDPSQTRNVPPGESNLDTLVRSFGDQVVAAGERGCGFEGSLEAWYRFLVDPEPPVTVTAALNAKGDAILTQKGPINRTILDQRKAFLRPDSLLAIVMLTDENDCSIVDQDGQQGWLATTTMDRLPRSSASCVNPDDP